MKKPRGKNLRLFSESIRRLTTVDLAKVGGGQPPTAAVVPVCLVLPVKQGTRSDCGYCL